MFLKNIFCLQRKVTQASERDLKYQTIMRNLVRRYVTQVHALVITTTMRMMAITMKMMTTRMRMITTTMRMMTTIMRMRIFEDGIDNSVDFRSSARQRMRE